MRSVSTALSAAVAFGEAEGEGVRRLCAGFRCRRGAVRGGRGTGFGDGARQGVATGGHEGLQLRVERRELAVLGRERRDRAASASTSAAPASASSAARPCSCAAMSAPSVAAEAAGVTTISPTPGTVRRNGSLASSAAPSTTSRPSVAIRTVAPGA